MIQLMNITKQTDNKHINMYKVDYMVNNDLYEYEFASRKSLTSLRTQRKSTDVVRVLPYIYMNGKIEVVIIKEFRYAINEWIYALVAGKIDEGENMETSARREVSEEIGATVKSMDIIDDNAYVSAGLTDESVALAVCEVELDKTPSLQGHEKIHMYTLPLDEIIKFTNEHTFCAQSKLMLLMYYYKTMFNINKIKGMNK